MTRIVIEDTWHVEANELTEMVSDAIRRVPVEMCDADRTTLSMESIETWQDDPHVLAEGEATVRASLCHRESAECRVEFTAVDTLPSAPEALSPAEVTLRIIEEQIGAE